jgi:hypothetical protein
MPTEPSNISLSHLTIPVDRYIHIVGYKKNRATFNLREIYRWSVLLLDGIPDSKWFITLFSPGLIITIKYKYIT